MEKTSRKATRKLNYLGIVRLLKGGSVRLPAVFRDDCALNHGSILHVFWDPDENLLVFRVERKPEITLVFK